MCVHKLLLKFPSINLKFLENLTTENLFVKDFFFEQLIQTRTYALFRKDIALQVSIDILHFNQIGISERFTY